MIVSGPEESNLGSRLAEAVRQRSQGPPSGASSSATPTPPQLRVLIVHGRDDLLVPLSNSERLAQLLPPGCGCELVVMEKCGHVPHEERPEQLAKMVAEFIGRGAE